MSQAASPVDDLDLERARAALVRKKLAEVEESAVEELNAIQAELQRRRFIVDPVYWAKERLGDTLWSKQREIIESVRDNRRTAVMSCHEIGKSFIASVIAGWWLDIHPAGKAFVVTSAPSGPQVKAILWREIGRVHARGKLPGRVNQTEWYMKGAAGNEEQVAMGRKPDEYDPTAFQGIHAPYVLYIFDEANGIRGGLHEAADSLIANDNGKALLISNPDDPEGEYYDACKPGSGWHVVQVGAFDTPNFTGEDVPLSILEQLIGRTYVEEKRRKWAKSWYWVDRDGKVATADTGARVVPPAGLNPKDANPFWQSKVLGMFPDKASAYGLIPISWVKNAQLRTLRPGAPNCLGADVGGGGEENAVCQRQGSVFRIIRTDRDPDTMSQCGKLIADLDSTGATYANIDKIGIGWGVVNRGQELRKPFIGINVGEGASEDEASASDERFHNLKAQLYWNLRDRFENGEIDIDPDDDDLAAELVTIRWERSSTGKIKIADKRKDANGKKIDSPNRAESLMLANAELPPEEDDFITW